MSNISEAKKLNDKATALAQSGSWLEARVTWIEARDLDDTWSVPSFNLARNFLEHTNHAPDVKSAEKYLNEAEQRANSGMHSEDSQVLTQLPMLRQWLSHKKSKFSMF